MNGGRGFATATIVPALLLLAVAVAATAAVSAGKGAGMDTGEPAATEATEIQPRTGPKPSTTTTAIPRSEQMGELQGLHVVPSNEPTTSTIPAAVVRDIPAMSMALSPLATDPLSQQLDISASVWVEGYGEVWALNPDLELFPASNQKLLTAAGALELLPADHVFETRVMATDDDLFLVAGGDPTLTVDGLDELARQVADRGLDHFQGDLIIDANRYDASRMAPGWQDWQMPTYVGPLSTLIVADNRWTNDPDFLANPDVHNGELFGAALRRAGVAIEGEVREGETPDHSQMIGFIQSPPVSTLVVTMMMRSDNEVAESLIREIGVLHADNGSTTAGLDAITQRLEAAMPLEGQNGDGSGLSRSNLHSARAWQQFLVRSTKAPWFEQFRLALPVAGQSGTLAGRLGGAATRGNVTAKTGTIIGGRALSGFVTLASGEDAVFSIVVNGEKSHLAKGLIDAWVTGLAEVHLR